MNFEKFILGTANLGTSYGLNNSQNYNRKTSLDILNYALSKGINKFDTAIEYGEAENLIGEAIGSKENIKIITKIPTRDSYSYEYVKNCLEQSTKKLQQNKIYGLMFHDPDIHKKNSLREISKRLLGSGTVDEIGFSAYTLEAVLAAKESYSDWSIFQVPENILDRRLLNCQELLELSQAKNTFFIRSIFLQGLLLMDIDKLPTKFHAAKEILKELNFFAAEKSAKIIDICVSYASSIPWSSGIIIAAASESQLGDILNYKRIELDFNRIRSLPNQILDPRQWDSLH